MRVCFFIPSLSDGGAQRQCIYLLNELQDRDDIELVLVTLREGVHDHLLRTDRLKWIRLGNRSGLDPRTVFGLWRVLRRERSDLLVTWLKASDTIGGIVRRFMPHVRWVMTERSAWYNRTIRNKLRLGVGRRADLIVANSNAGREFWMTFRPRCDVITIDNVVLRIDPQRLSSASADVVAVGRLVANKNILTTSQGIRVVVDRNPQVRGAIIGQGALEQNVREIVDGTAGRLNYLGFRPDAVSFIAEARVLVSMSQLEGMPNVVLEAVAHGTIPVLSAIPEHIEVVGADYPYLVPRDAEPDIVAERIEAALDATFDSPALDFARERIDRMTASSVVAAYLDAFAAVLRRG